MGNSLAMKIFSRTQKFSIFFIFIADRIKSSSIVLSDNENLDDINSLNLSGESSSENGLFPDTYQDNFGEIQPRIFIEDEFIGKEVLTSGRVEFDENDEPYSKVTVISVQDELPEESWFDSFVNRLNQMFLYF